MRALTTILAIILALALTGNVQPNSPVMWVADNLTWDEVSTVIISIAVGSTIISGSVLFWLIFKFFGSPRTWWAEFKSGKLNFQ